MLLYRAATDGRARTAAGRPSSPSGARPPAPDATDSDRAVSRARCGQLAMERPCLQRRLAGVPTFARTNDIAYARSVSGTDSGNRLEPYGIGTREAVVSVTDLDVSAGPWIEAVPPVQDPGPATGSQVERPRRRPGGVDHGEGY